MEDIEQLQYSGLTDNKDEMTSLGDYKIGLFLYIKYLLDMFKYLVDANKERPLKLNKLLKSFNDTFDTDFITKNDLIKEFGSDLVNNNPETQNINIVLKSSNRYKTLQEEIRKQNATLFSLKKKTGNVKVTNSAKSVTHQSEGVEANGGNNDENDSNKKLLQYLTFIDTLHDFDDTIKLRTIYNNNDSKQDLTNKIIDDIKDGFKNNEITEEMVEDMKDKLNLGDDKHNLEFLVNKAEELLKSNSNMYKDLQCLWDVLYNKKSCEDNEIEKIENVDKIDLFNILSKWSDINNNKTGKEKFITILIDYNTKQSGGAIEHDLTIKINNYVNDHINNQEDQKNLNNLKKYSVNLRDLVNSSQFKSGANNFKSFIENKSSTYKSEYKVHNDTTYGEIHEMIEFFTKILDMGKLKHSYYVKLNSILLSKGYSKKSEEYIIIDGNEYLLSDITIIDYKLNNNEKIKIKHNEKIKIKYNNSIVKEINKKDFFDDLLEIILNFTDITYTFNITDKNIISDALGLKTNSYNLITGLIYSTDVRDIIYKIKNSIENSLNNNHRITDEELKEKLDGLSNKSLQTLTRIFDPGHQPHADNTFKPSFCTKSIHSTICKDIGLLYTIKLEQNIDFDNLNKVIINYQEKCDDKKEKNKEDEKTDKKEDEKEKDEEDEEDEEDDEEDQEDEKTDKKEEDEKTDKKEEVTYEYESKSRLSISEIYKLLQDDCGDNNKICNELLEKNLPRYVLYGLKRSGDKGIIESAVNLCDEKPTGINEDEESIYKRDRLLISNDGPALFYALLRNCHLIGMSMSIHDNTAHVIELNNP